MARWGHFYYRKAHYDEPETTPPVRIKRTYMFDLHKPFNNPFDDVAISIDNLVDFTSDHLGKMKDNNTGGFLTARIAATQAAFDAVNSAFQLDEGSLGDRKTSKAAKANYRQTIKDEAGTIYSALQGSYGKKSPMLATFFPHGLTGFNSTRDDQMGNELTTLVTKLTAHQTEFPASVVTQATALKTGWAAVYAPSESTSAAKDTTMGAKNTARQALQLELCKNWLTIALQFPRQPEKLDVYMQPSLLSPHNPAPATPTPTPPATPTPTP
jgi:hypothetical protein